LKNQLIQEQLELFAQTVIRKTEKNLNYICEHQKEFGFSCSTKCSARGQNRQTIRSVSLELVDHFVVWSMATLKQK